MNDKDKQILALLKDFLPEKIFDVHAHLCNVELQTDFTGFNREYGTTEAKRFQEDQKQLLGDREIRGMMIPMPVPSLWKNRDEINQWVVEQAASMPGFAAEVYVLPTDTVADIEAMLTHPCIKGFKCYYMTALGDAGDQSDIADFLPESAWQVANERGLCITLHMMKTLSPADPVNQEYILTMARKYPNAKLILAHCGRGFATWTILQTARKFKGIDNIYYDLAAICDSAAMFEVIRQAGADHVMWGSDYPLAMNEWRPYTMGIASRWLDPERCPGLVIGSLETESLLNFYQASLMLDLSRQEIADIFWNNAVRLLKLDV